MIENFISVRRLEKFNCVVDSNHSFLNLQSSYLRNPPLKNNG